MPAVVILYMITCTNFKETKLFLEGNNGVFVDDGVVYSPTVKACRTVFCISQSG